MDDDERSNEETFASYSSSFKDAECSKVVLDQKPSEGRPSPRGLEHCITAPAGTERSRFLDEHEIVFNRSATEKRETPRKDLMLDRLSEREKQKLIVELVKIQNDGTVEVDLGTNSPVASELLELKSFEESATRGSFTSESNKSVPRLQIVILAVGTREDVQPFLAIAKWLQACLNVFHHISTFAWRNLFFLNVKRWSNFYFQDYDHHVRYGEK